MTTRTDGAPAPLIPDVAARTGTAATSAVAGALLLVGGAVMAGEAGGWRTAALWIVAAALGLVLHHAAFGFTAGYRDLLARGAAAPVRAQILLLGLLALVAWPAIDAGALAGQPVRGFVLPMGLELALGAFLFGVGMQVAGGCASGTLQAAGGGSLRPLLTLAAIVAGATAAAATFGAWAGLPDLPAVSLPRSLGLWPALALQIALLAALWIAAGAVERRAGAAPRPLLRLPGASLARGPWPLGWGAVALAALMLLTLALAGRPWAITQAFAVWGSWAVDAAGLDDPHFWPYWETPTRVDLLHRPFWADVTSVMDLGVIVGALAAAGLAGRFAFRWRLRPGEAASALLGGLALGFGATMATGCNIGAFVSGIASGSLHGWIWILAALPGNALGLRLRPLFGLDGPNPRQTP